MSVETLKAVEQVKAWAARFGSEVSAPVGVGPRPADLRVLLSALASQAELLIETERSLEPRQLAQQFHETYERLAPTFSYSTRKASAVPWAEVPSQNKALMIAVCEEIARSLLLRIQGDKPDNRSAET